MATQTVPLQPHPGDAQAAAELERALGHVPADGWSRFARWVEACLTATDPARRHLLQVVQEQDAARLFEPLVWVGDRLEVRPPSTPTIACRWDGPAPD